MTLTATNGTIYPGYPYISVVNAVCYWIMTAPVGKVFRIEIDVFVNPKRGCRDSSNLVRIYDGNSTGSDVRLEHNCTINKRFSTYFFSTGHSVLLEVKTGSRAEVSGFRMKYRALTKQGKTRRAWHSHI